MPKINSRKLRTNLYGFSQAVNVVTTGRWILLCILVGIVAGLSSIVFSYLISHLQDLSLSGWAGFSLPEPGGESITGNSAESVTGNIILTFSQNWPVIVLPAIGGLISGFLVFTWAPEAKGHGTDSVIKAYHHNKGIIKPIVPVIKIIASAFTIGTGGSAGKEGPIAQIVAGFGSFLSQKINLSEKERKILVMAGIGAGIGSIFKAPIGGAIFSSEVLYRKDMESDGLMASIIAAIVGYSIYASVSGWEPMFSFQPVHFQKPLELPLYILLAILIMVAGIIYTKIFYKTEEIFDRFKISNYYKPAIGGLLVGIMGFFYPSVLGSSYGFLQAALHGNLAISFMLILAILKILATSLTISSGGSGGVFAPSLVIGGLIGGAFGFAAQAMFPGLVTTPEGFVLVGMASFFAGAANVPIASTILITEMSESYGLLVPLLFASAIAYIGAQSWSIYKQQLEDRFASQSHRGQFMSDVLENVKVRSAYRRVHNMPIVNFKCHVRDIIDAFTTAETLVLPVENDQGKIVGLISLYDVRALLDEENNDLIIAADIMYHAKSLHLNDPLNKAFDQFIETGLPEIPVLKHGKENEFIGTLSERGFLIAYERAIKSDEYETAQP